MDSLRIILIIIGLSIVVGLYIWDRHKKQTKNLRYGKWRRDYRMTQPQTAAPDPDDEDNEEDYFPQDDTEEDYDDFDEPDEAIEERIEPTLNQQSMFEPEDDRTQDVLDAMQDAMRDNSEDIREQEPIIAPAELPPAEQIIAFNILADSRNTNLHFYGPKLEEQFSAHGLTFGPMNIYHYLQNGLPVFSIANIVEPGVFDHDGMSNFETPGLVIFMQLPNAIDPAQAFDRMLDTARSLASSLDGELRDDARSVLTRQAISRLKEIIAEFVLKQQRSG